MIWFDGVHMMTDSDDLEELHLEAERIGLERAYFQDHPTHPHYDLWGRWARRIGVNCTSRELLRRCRRPEASQGAEVREAVARSRWG